MIEHLVIEQATVQAMRWDGTPEGARDIEAWTGCLFDWWLAGNRTFARLRIRATNGWASVEAGQWVFQVPAGGYCVATSSTVAALTQPAEVAA